MSNVEQVLRRLVEKQQELAACYAQLAEELKRIADNVSILSERGGLGPLQ